VDADRTKARFFAAQRARAGAQLNLFDDIRRFLEIEEEGKSAQDWAPGPWKCRRRGSDADRATIHSSRLLTVEWQEKALSIPYSDSVDSRNT
jgi:hypothetical protein